MPPEHLSAPDRAPRPDRSDRSEAAPFPDAAAIRAARLEREAAEAAAQAEAWPPEKERALLAQLDKTDEDPQADPETAAEDLTEAAESAPELADAAIMDAALDDFLAELDMGELAGVADFPEDLGVETEAALEPADPEIRRAELEAWIVETFPDFQLAAAAVALVEDYEADRQRIDPSYDVVRDANGVDKIRERLEEVGAIVETHEEAAANGEKETEIAEKTILAEGGEAVAESADLDSEVREEAALEQEDQDASVEKAQESLRNEEATVEKAGTAQRLNSLAALIAPYNEMLPRLGQAATLQALMQRADSPEIKGRLAAILATLDRVSAAVAVGDRAVVQAIFARAPLNLAGASVIDSFGPALRLVEADETLAPETKAAVRAAVLGETYVQRGSQLREAAQEMVADPETGEPTPRYTEDHPKEIRPGVSAYTETGDEVLVRLDLPGHPPVVRDVAGWSDEDIGLLAEAMGFAAGLERFGATGFVEDVYKIDFSLLGESAFDRESLRNIRQMISAMVGTFEGYDGDIFDVRDKIGLIRHQARLINPQNTATGFENNREATRAAVRRLGFFDEDGQMNLDVLQVFGAYSQTTYLSGDADHAGLRRYLHERFPSLAEPPEDAAPL